MATTPSGLSISAAEELSRRQQQQSQANKAQLKEGQLFYLDIGEGGKQLAQYKGGQLNTLGYTPPPLTGGPGLERDWGGQTIGQLQNKTTQEAISQLGLNPNDIIDLSGDQNYLWRDVIKGLKQNQVTDINQFKLSPTATGGNLGVMPDLTAQQKAATWQDTTTGQPTPAGIGMPTPTIPQGTQISNEVDLQAKRQELAKAGIPQTEWSKYISSPDAKGRLFYNHPATLISSTGAKKVVPTGSTEANNLLNTGWSLMGQVSDGTVDTGLLSPQTDITTGKDTTQNSYLTDTAGASSGATSKATDEEIKRLQELLTPKETDLSKQVSELYAGLGEDAESLTGRGAMQLAEEQKRNIETKTQALTSKNTELKTKLAEIDALTDSYQLANRQAEGVPMTLSRLQGQQGQNYRQFLAQKNLLTSEASYLQANILGLQGELDSAQSAADRAVNLEYQDRTDAYNAKLTQLNILLPQLEKSEKIYGESVKMMLEQQQQAIAEEKSQKQSLVKFNLGMIADNPSAGIKMTDSPEIVAQKTASMPKEMTSLEEYEAKKKIDLRYDTATGVGTGGIIGQISSQTQAIIDNPSLFDNLTPTRAGIVITELQSNGYDTSNLGVKGLSDSAIKEIAQTQKALSDLTDLKSTIENNLEYIGPITGLAKYNPWSKAKQVQADIDRVKQIVGKALEGGVLRKEDEEKYKRILAQITDTPTTAIYKIDSLFSSIQRDIENYKSLQQSSGKSLDVKASLQKKGEIIITPEEAQKRFHY